MGRAGVHDGHLANNDLVASVAAIGDLGAGNERQQTRFLEALYPRANFVGATGRRSRGDNLAGLFPVGDAYRRLASSFGKALLWDCRETLRKVLGISSRKEGKRPAPISLPELTFGPPLPLLSLLTGRRLLGILRRDAIRLLLEEELAELLLGAGAHYRAALQGLGVGRVAPRLTRRLELAALVGHVQVPLLLGVKVADGPVVGLVDLPDHALAQVTQADIELQVRARHDIQAEPVLQRPVEVATIRSRILASHLLAEALNWRNASIYYGYYKEYEYSIPGYARAHGIMNYL